MKIVRGRSSKYNFYNASLQIYTVYMKLTCSYSPEEDLKSTNPAAP